MRMRIRDTISSLLTIPYPPRTHTEIHSQLPLSPQPLPHGTVDIASAVKPGRRGGVSLQSYGEEVRRFLEASTTGSCLAAPLHMLHTPLTSAACVHTPPKEERRGQGQLELHNQFYPSVPSLHQHQQWLPMPQLPETTA